MSPQNDYFADLLESDAPQARPIEHAGKTKTVYFRRITGAERVKLLAGKRVNVGDCNTMDLDLADVLRNRHQLVQFSACQEDGKPLFKSLEEVQALPDWLLTALAEHADDVNKDEDTAGKQ